MTKLLLMLFSAVFLALFSLMAPKFAAADDHQTCIDVLNAPPFVDILTRNDGRDFGELNASKAGQALVGLKCGIDELTIYFESAGWDQLDYQIETHGWVDGSYIRVPERLMRSRASFCLKQRRFPYLKRRCGNAILVTLRAGKIHDVIPQIVK